MWSLPHSGPAINVTIASSKEQSNTNQSAPPYPNPLFADTVKRLSNPTPKSHHVRSLIKNHKLKRPKNTPTQSLLLPSLQINHVLLKIAPLYSKIINPISTHQAQIQQTQAQQQQFQTNTQILLPYSGFIANTTLQPPTIIPAPPRAPQPKIKNYSNTPQFSSQTINFANTDKTNSSELPQPVHTVSNINDTPQDISLLSGTFISDPPNS